MNFHDFFLAFRRKAVKRELDLDILVSQLQFLISEFQNGSFRVSDIPIMEQKIEELSIVCKLIPKGNHLYQVYQSWFQWIKSCTIADSSLHTSREEQHN
jgi:hypothetical protein